MTPRNILNVGKHLPTKPATQTTAPPAVAVLVDTATGWGRRLIRGVTRYSIQNGPWHLWIETRGPHDSMVLPEDWDGQGVIARVTTEEMANLLKKSKVRVINVSSIQVPGADFPRVLLDFDSIGSLAASHFVDIGYRRCAFVGPMDLPHVRVRYEAFKRHIVALGGSCEVFDYPLSLLSSRRSFSKHSEMSRWLKAVPKPIGVFSWSTEWGLHLIDACRYHKVSVPDEVAVLGGDDDSLMAETAVPGLSAVVTRADRVGYVAAEMLNLLMQGRRAEVPPETKISSEEINVRGSTDALAIDDPELARAVIYMRRNAYRNLTIEEVASKVPMTRRSLERKFKRYFERSPFEELRRLRLARVRTLLVTTDYSIPEVAELSGFGDPEHLATTFRKVFDITPLKFRLIHRARRP
jgi:LacI family transcriptional regulator